MKRKVDDEEKGGWRRERWMTKRELDGKEKGGANR